MKKGKYGKYEENVTERLKQTEQKDNRKKENWKLRAEVRKLNIDNGRNIKENKNGTEIENKDERNNNGKEIETRKDEGKKRMEQKVKKQTK